MDAQTIIPRPAEIRRRIDAHQQALRELRRLYRLARAAERATEAERQTSQLPAVERPSPGGVE